MENGKWKIKLIELIIENFSNNQLFSIFHFPFSIHLNLLFLKHYLYSQNISGKNYEV